MGMGIKTGLLALSLCTAALHGVARAEDADEAAGNGGNNSSSYNNQLTYWATVSSKGGIQARRGLAGVTKIGTGQYVVTFKTNVTGCLFNATITSLNDKFPISGQIAVVQTANKAVSVATYNASGTGDDQDFYLVATCPPDK